MIWCPLAQSSLTDDSAIFSKVRSPTPSNSGLFLMVLNIYVLCYPENAPRRRAADRTLILPSAAGTTGSGPNPPAVGHVYSRMRKPGTPPIFRRWDTRPCYLELNRIALVGPEAVTLVTLGIRRVVSTARFGAPDRSGQRFSDSDGLRPSIRLCTHGDLMRPEQISRPAISARRYSFGRDSPTGSLSASTLTGYLYRPLPDSRINAAMVSTRVGAEALPPCDASPGGCGVKKSEFVGLSSL